MVLLRPVSQTVISTSTFGMPVYDWIAYWTPTAWTQATLLNGWTHQSGSPLSYRKRGDFVDLKGRCDNASGIAWANVFQLPTGMRPPGVTIIMSPVVMAGVWTGSPLNVAPDGFVSTMAGVTAYAPVGSFPVS